MSTGHLLRVFVAMGMVELETSFVVIGLLVVGFSVVDCGFPIVEHALTPSLHVCSNVLSPGAPHFPRQDPPGPQQVSAPMPLRPHLGHTKK